MANILALSDDREDNRKKIEKNTDVIIAAWLVAAKEFASGKIDFLSFVDSIVETADLLSLHSYALNADNQVRAGVVAMGVGIACLAIAGTKGSLGVKEIRTSAEKRKLIENIMLTHQGNKGSFCAYSYRDQVSDFANTLLCIAKRSDLPIEKGLHRTAIDLRIREIRKERGLLPKVS